MFKRALEHQQSPQVAFELAKILASQSFLTESLVYFTRAIDLSSGVSTDIGGERLAEYHMHRSLIYEALGLTELSSKDLIKIQVYDPQFREKYQEEYQK